MPSAYASALGLARFGGILRDREETWHTAALAVLAPHQIPRTLRRDQYHIKILARFDLLEVNIEAVGEQQRRAFLKARAQFGIQRLLRQIGDQHGDQLRAFDGRGGLRDLQSILLGPAPAVTLAYPDHDIVAAVAQIERVRAPLTAVAENGDARAAQGLLVDVLLGIQTHSNLLIQS